ncbi:hypothetical protein [Streptomyces cinereoruber]|uniref:hypothetical protein n=1 Tax=Streptomyces cinereoruber TaxID=67260 RepID=UPI00363F0457
MKKPTGKPTLIAGAVASARVLTAAPASAAPPTVWTVGPSPVGVSLSNGANVVMNVNGIAWTCTKSTASATWRSATGNPASIGTFGSVSFAAAELPVVESLNGGAAFPVGAGPVIKAGYLVKKTGTTVVPTITGSNP